MSLSATLKPKKCKARGCGVAFTPRNPMQCVCGPSCAHLFTRDKKEQAETKARQASRRADRAKRESLKTRSDWIKDAQKEFNKFIRTRDAGQPCICCGVHLERDAIGGGFDAGHYRSVGSAPHLRFDERNVHAQRKHCNRYGAGRAVDYRIGLIKRIGREAVESLESDQSPKHYTIPDLIAIRDKYKAMTKQLMETCE